MIAVKKADILIQLLIIAVAVIMISQHGLDKMFHFYFVIGGWQITSCLVHHFFLPQQRTELRKLYAWAMLFSLVITGIVVQLFPALLFLFIVFLVIWIPIITVFYLFTCIMEIKALQHRKLIPLKN